MHSFSEFSKNEAEKDDVAELGFLLQYILNPSNSGCIWLPELGWVRNELWNHKGW